MTSHTHGCGPISLLQGSWCVSKHEFCNKVRKDYRYARVNYHHHQQMAHLESPYLRAHNLNSNSYITYWLWWHESTMLGCTEIQGLRLILRFMSSPLQGRMHNIAKILQNTAPTRHIQILSKFPCTMLLCLPRDFSAVQAGTTATPTPNVAHDVCNAQNPNHNLLVGFRTRSTTTQPVSTHSINSSSNEIVSVWFQTLIITKYVMASRKVEVWPSGIIITTKIKIKQAHRVSCCCGFHMHQ